MRDDAPLLVRIYAAPPGVRAASRDRQPAEGRVSAPPRSSGTAPIRADRLAVRFVLVVGVLSLFADMTYEGARSVSGPYLGMLGASATVISLVAGAGELATYALRIASGRAADRTGRYWPVAIAGYVLQMSSVPLLALTGSWRSAAVLIILERVGKAIRNPPRDVMLSHAAKAAGGYGWAFGLHEAFDQFGAMLGPLLVAAVLALGGGYGHAFAILAVPASINMGLVLLARRLYPKPEDLEATPPGTGGTRLPRIYWAYLCATGLVAAGFADFPLIAFHLQQADGLPVEWVAGLYAVAMAVSATGSLVLGRLFDRLGFKVLIVLTAACSAFAPLVFLGGFWWALAGAAVWGLGMGVHESIIPAAVTPMVPRGRRGSAYGIFASAYGLSWFAGSAVIGLLYDASMPVTVGFCVGCQVAALPILSWVARRHASETSDGGTRA